MDGSSSIRSRGFDASPRAIATICCSPPESVPAACVRRSASRGNSVNTSSSVSFQSCRASGDCAPISRFSYTDRLGNTCRPSGTCAMPRAGRSCGSDVARGRGRRRSCGPRLERHHAGDRAEQRRLAGAVRPDDRDELAGADVQLDTPSSAREPPYETRDVAQASARATHRLPRYASITRGCSVTALADRPRPSPRRGRARRSRSASRTMACIVCSMMTTVTPSRRMPAIDLQHVLDLGRAEPGEDLVEEQQARPRTRAPARAPSGAARRW